MRTTDVFIRGLGVYLPDSVSIDWAVAQGLFPADQVGVQGWTGAAIAGDVPAPEMGLQAAQHALKRGGWQADDVDLLLYANSWHQGPDGWQPQYHLQRHLLGGRPLSVQLQHGCNGMFSAFELGASYLLADEQRRAALLVSSDNWGTPMINRWHPGPGLMMGDAACAVLLTREPGFARLLSVCSITVPEAEEVHRAGEPMFPPGVTVGRAMDLHARSQRFREQIMAGQGDPAALLKVQQTMLLSVEQSLAEAGITAADVTRVAFMNMSQEAINDRGTAALGLRPEQTTWDFGRTVGHMGASDQVMSFEHLVDSGRLGAGDHMLLVGVGPGINLSAAVIEVVDTPPWK
ncbi:ketoacyl-ACP synthase III family protein [Nonomuraea rosea]|uniref:Ketoacyl-ACP synthase III family protein n=1 Tax=Nonomuraea rosea TaxID=638574 RepID=A0ABP6XHR9_9ACTN